MRWNSTPNSGNSTSTQTQQVGDNTGKQTRSYDLDESPMTPENMKYQGCTNKDTPKSRSFVGTATDATQTCHINAWSRRQHNHKRRTGCHTRWCDRRLTPLFTNHHYPRTLGDWLFIQFIPLSKSIRFKIRGSCCRPRLTSKTYS